MAPGTIKFHSAKHDAVIQDLQFMEGSEEKFSDTTHGCSFCAMLIISLMAINGSNVLMALGGALYLNVLPLARILASLTKERGSDKTSDMTTQLRSFAPKITLWRVCQRLSVQTVNGAIINQVVKLHVRNLSHQRMAGKEIEISGMDAL